MKIIYSGSLINYELVISATISSSNILTFDKMGSVNLTVDTGFTGGIALPKKTLAMLNLKFSAVQEFILADGKSICVKVYNGFAFFGKSKIKTNFIEGEGLIGMEFMESLSELFFIDFKKKIYFFLNKN